MGGKPVWFIACGVVFVALSSANVRSALAETIAEKVEVCAGCHGQGGKPIDAMTPIIWGQQSGYIYIQLRDFKRGDRKSEVMQPIASSFEKQDMLAIAEYFSSKPWPDLGQPRSAKENAERALRAEHSVGCTGCHQDSYLGEGTQPRLAGQWKDYLQQSMLDFRTRKRANNPGMSDLMLATSEDDIKALAEYLAGL